MTAAPEPRSRSQRARRGSTATATFGSGRRESHDASAFYDRFVAPELSDDAVVNPAPAANVIHTADARDMSAVASSSIALVVTSPPYFAGKEYEESLGRNGVPGSYMEYLALLTDVFDECRRVLEPGGRIAVNVANLGRRPYRSLAGDVTQILQDLGLLLRGEIVWWKGRAAGGSCAWGTFQRPANPVLRDVTERIVIASKGRFDRAVTPGQRHQRGLPSVTTISRDEFMEATTDLWEMAPERASRVGHPAPFPVELPTRLIHLYTYEEDVVLDPFMGSGTTAVAAVRTGRRYVGFEMDPAYAERARERVAAEVEHPEPALAVRIPAPHQGTEDAATTDPDNHAELGTTNAVRHGVQARELARQVLEECGFERVRTNCKLPGTGVDVQFLARDRTGTDWGFDMAGAFTTTGSGLRRTDTLLKSVGKAAIIAGGAPGLPFVLLTTGAPTRGSAGAQALAAVLGKDKPVRDVIELLDPAGLDRLRQYAEKGAAVTNLPTA